MKMVANFGNILKELRVQSGMTQQQLAEKLGVTKSVVSYYELSERTPSPEILLKLAALFHVSTDFLLGKERQPKDFIDLTGLEEGDKILVRNLVVSLKEKTKTIK